MRTFYVCIALLMLCSCNKAVDAILQKSITAATTTKVTDNFTRYTIKKGQHYSDQNGYKPIENATEMNFVVKFDSSAVYQTITSENQFDINKLYGFSDNSMDHHQFSARFGWRWSEGALRLFAYVYNNGKMEEKELSAIAIGAEVPCSIKIVDGNYQFIANGKTVLMPRKSNTAKAMGYQLYPYFGGDETAPHDVNIWIKGL